MTLITHHLEFSATAVTPLELDDQAGESIRGAVLGGLWERFCANKAAPTWPAARRKPHRQRVAHQLAVKLDLAGEDRAAAFCIARPALAELQFEIGRHRADQRVAVERAGREGAPHVAAPAGEDVGRLGGCRAARQRPQAAGRSRSQRPGPAVLLIPLRNK